APADGEIVKVNSALSDAPETVNEDPYGEGWMIQVKLADPAQLDKLLSAEEYEAFVSEEA
ncbi:MAG: glycine cleavage system protein H, partial [Coriobacteriia bacterium]|nr:glycine cleavage system protein H [Coriobacteriia bacterium]